MVRSTGIAAGLLLALAAAGCGDDGGGGAPGGEAPEVQGEEVAILRAFPAQTSGGIAEPRREVFRDGKPFEEAWKRANAHLAPVPRAPTVDFAKEMVALLSLGRQATAGHGVEIVGAREADGRLRILYSVRAPGPDEVVAQVRTHPWHAVVLPRSDLPVEWVEYRPPGRK